MRVAICSGRYGALTVLSPAGSDGECFLWLCLCDCGKTIAVPGKRLRSGDKSSCGCRWHLGTVKHGEARKGNLTPEFKTWRGMLTRCLNPNATRFSYYGGRGITVCQEWRESFSAFLESVGRKPSPQHSLDRINNDAGYEPGNCRWATRSEQMKNRRKWQCAKLEKELAPSVEDVSHGDPELPDEQHPAGWGDDPAENFKR